jgi:hypothetical protein
MFAARKVRRRIDDALAVASPLALADAMDAHIAGRSEEDVRELIERSVKRMDAADRRQLELYLDPRGTDDLLGHRFSAFLRQNPRALSALDPDVLDAILGQLGELPAVEHPVRRLPAGVAGLVALTLIVAILPLAAQYVHQRGLLQDLNAPQPPAPITPFVQQRVALGSMLPIRRAHHALPHRAVSHHAVVHRAKHHTAPYVAYRKRAVPKRAIAYMPRPHRRVRVHHHVWRHADVADASKLGARARLDVRGYLRAIIDGNLPAALAHLGMPATSSRSALAELPIISRRTRVAILGSRPQARGTEQVQADIVTDGREYYEVFYVVRDGPAVRITQRYYIPVNRSAQVAMRSLVQHPH